MAKQRHHIGPFTILALCGFMLTLAVAFGTTTTSRALTTAPLKLTPTKNGLAKINPSYNVAAPAEPVTTITTAGQFNNAVSYNLALQQIKADLPNQH